MRVAVMRLAADGTALGFYITSKYGKSTIIEGPAYGEEISSNELIAENL